jgi:hypothetical protein
VIWLIRRCAGMAVYLSLGSFNPGNDSIVKVYCSADVEQACIVASSMSSSKYHSSCPKTTIVPVLWTDSTVLSNLGHSTITLQKIELLLPTLVTLQRRIVLELIRQTPFSHTPTLETAKTAAFKLTIEETNKQISQ